ncbi:MAG: acetolactate synthase small subunit [Acidobacteriota bacterium]
MSANRHVLSISTANEPGELARIAGMFSARGLNIESLSVRPAENPAVSLLVVVTQGQPKRVDQLVHQLRRLVRVSRVTRLPDNGRVEREVALIRLRAAGDSSLGEVSKTMSCLNARVLDSNSEEILIEAAGSANQVAELLSRLQPFGTLQVVRGGTVAVEWSNPSNCDP